MKIQLFLHWIEVLLAYIYSSICVLSHASLMALTVKACFLVSTSSIEKAFITFCL